MARKRRGRGEGSIYPRADGLWASSVSLGYDARGKRRRRTVYGATKQEVVEKLKEIHRAGPGAAAGPLTVSRFLSSWLEAARPAIEPTSWDGYEQHVRVHIVPRIGGVKLSALTALHVEEMVSGLLRDGVSKPMARHVGLTLRTALNVAVGKGYLPGNVAKLVPLPKRPRHVPKVFTPDQVAAFTAAAAADRFEALYWLAVDSGCRQGELLALHWPDFDPAAGALTVTKALASRKGKAYLKEVKKDRSRRRVVLSFALDALGRHRERMRAAGFDVEAGLMFPNRLGGFMSRNNLYGRYFLPTLARAGLPEIRFHDLRHCCASLMLAAGVDTKVVSERLGHATPGFTANTYQHVLPGLQEAAAERLKALLTAPTPGKGKKGRKKAG